MARPRTPGDEAECAVAARTMLGAPHELPASPPLTSEAGSDITRAERAA